MEDIQAWFAPLLWIIATITAIAGFIRFCKPIHQIFVAPQEYRDLLNESISDINKVLVDIDTRLGKYDVILQELKDQNLRQDEIQLSLLHDQIVQIYQAAKGQGGYISDDDFKRAYDLHGKNGHSEYIESLMKTM